jgi:septum site-determining protein MinD
MLPGSWGFEKADISQSDICFIVGSLLERFDYVIIDCPAGIDKGFQSASACAQRALVVAAPDLNSVKDAAQVANILRSKGISDIRLIINKVKPEIASRGLAVNLDEIIDMVGLQLISAMPDDDSVLVCANRRELVLEHKGSVAAELNNLAARLEGESVPLERFCPKRIFNRLFG